MALSGTLGLRSTMPWRWLSRPRSTDLAPARQLRHGRRSAPDNGERHMRDWPCALRPLSGGRPYSKWAMLCRQREVPVRSEKGEVVPNAKLRDERINRPHLHACAPAAVAKFSSFNMVVSIGNQHRQRGKLLEKFLAGFGARKAL